VDADNFLKNWKLYQIFIAFYSGRKKLFSIMVADLVMVFFS
jgi:hypothetical protein